MSLPVVLGAVLLAGACGTSQFTDSAAGTPSASGPAVVTPTPSAATAARTQQHAGRTAVVPGPAAVASEAPKALRPVRIQVPAIGVDSTLTDLGIIAKDGVIEVPTNPLQAGWLDTTPAPGEQGPAVIAGHVDSLTGPAVFYELSDLKVGDPIIVTRRNGSKARFTVDGLRTYEKSAFPSAEVYGPVPGPALRLITCGGDYVKSRGGYQANLVVYAS